MCCYTALWNAEVVVWPFTTNVQDDSFQLSNLLLETTITEFEKKSYRMNDTNENIIRHILVGANAKLETRHSRSYRSL